MVNIEHHHRRIRYKALAVHFALIPMALAVPVAWIYMTFGLCQEAESPLMLTACRVFQLIPMLPAVLGVLALALIAWDLHALGVELHLEKHGVKPDRPGWAHAVRGYRAIDHRHRRHFHLAALQVVLVGLALMAWLVYEIYRTTY